MVELLTQSNCSRYTEFKAVGKVYRLFEGSVEQVPCSRADLFSSQAVSMLEKRRMMKFLSFCSDYTSQPDAFQGECSSVRIVCVILPRRTGLLFSKLYFALCYIS